MSGRDLAAMRAGVLERIAAAGRTASSSPDAETALAAITRVPYELLGDREAHLRAGALKAGEHQFFVAGIFLVSADAGEHLLVAEHGFPAEQHRLRIPLDIGHPGQVYRDRTSLILENTDEHAGFRQILKTARMGSALYAPLIWQGRFIGQLVTAAQARNTFSPPDLGVLEAIAELATVTFVAHDGQRLLDGAPQGQ